MTKEEKNQFISELQDYIGQFPHFYVTDTSGLDAENTSKLRRLAFKRDIKIRVVKNTLLKKALENIEGVDYTGLFDSLKGTSALMFTETGNAPAKMIKEFRKKSDKPKLKAAFVEETVYLGEEQLEALVNVKSKEELIGDVITLLQSPAKNVVSALQSGGNKLSGILKTLENRA